MWRAIQARRRRWPRASTTTSFRWTSSRPVRAPARNMNANEVIAPLATSRRGKKVHPNDHVNMGQSSNDVIPTAIHVARHRAGQQELLPALAALVADAGEKAASVERHGEDRPHPPDGRDAGTLGQELGGWASQIEHGIERLRGVPPRWRSWRRAARPSARASTHIRSSAARVARSYRSGRACTFVTARESTSSLSARRTRRSS